MTRLVPLLVCVVAGALAPSPLAGQLPTATLEKMKVDTLQRADGTTVVDTSFTVFIGRTRYIVISFARERDNQKMDSDLRAARQQLAILRSDVEALKNYRTLADNVLRNSDSLIVLYRENERDYRKLNRIYEKLAREEFLSVEGGLGVTDITGDTRTALLLGAGFRRFRLWGFFQQNNTGVAVGVHFPLLRF
jgi:hypothetical protein